MLAASAGLIAVLSSVEQSGVAVRLRMTLPGGVYPDVSLTIEQLSIDASITTDMPDGTRLFAGYPAVQATFTLAGLVDQRDESLTAAWLFGIYPVAATIPSPLYRKTVLGSVVTIDVGAPPIGSGVSVEWLRKFTGTIDSLAVDPVAGSVAFTCIDNRNLLRSVPAIPAVATSPPYNAGLTGEFIMDALLRVATGGTISSWPATRASAILSVGLRASLWAEVGGLFSLLISQPTPSFGPGANGTALTGLTVKPLDYPAVNYATTVPLVDTVNTVWIEFWVSNLTFGNIFVSLSDVGDLNEIALVCTPTDVTAYVTGEGMSSGFATFTTNMTGPKKYVAVKVTVPAVGNNVWPTSVYVDNGVLAPVNLVTGNPRGAHTGGMCIVTVSPTGGGGISGLQVTTETAPIPNGSFVPKAVLDPSLNTLQVVPGIDAGTDPWSVLQALADAELGVGGFDESGIYHFYNRETIRSSPVVRTLLSNVDLKSLTITSDAASFANHTTVPYTPWGFAPMGLVWSATSTMSVKPRSTQVFQVSVDGAVGGVDKTVSVLANNASVVDGQSHYRAASSDTGTANFPSGYLTVSVKIVGGGLAVTVVNTHPSLTAYLVNSSAYTDTVGLPGVPTLWIGGITAAPADEITVDFQYPDIANGGAASSPRGDVAVALPSDPWIQDRASAEALALDLLIDLYLPRPNFGSLDIVPDWRLQLLDRVRVTDLDASGVDEYAQIWGWSLSFDASSWSMTVDARTITSPGQWILGVAGRSELGQTTWI